MEVKTARTPKSAGVYSRVNTGAASGPVQVSETLFEAIQAGVEWHRRTGGAFDITVGPLLKLWKTAGQRGELPTDAELSGARALVGADRLVLDPGRRTVLWQVKGRILHPAWTADGRHLFACADHTGVANAWRIDPAAPGTAVPVTNTIGGVLACVPSPDGRFLAIIDHDRQGPFAARINRESSQWAPLLQSARGGAS